MNVLGVIARARPADAQAVAEALARIDGVDVALRAPDGRLILVIEDTGSTTAAAAMAQVTVHPLVLNTSLVYEYTGASGADDGLDGYNAWRMSAHEIARSTPAPSAASTPDAHFP